MKKKLELATNVAIIIFCSVAVVVLAKRYLFTDTPPPTEKPPEIAVGETFVNFSETVATNAEKILMVFISSQCQFCQMSLPFYKQLFEKAGSSEVRVITAIHESDDENAVHEMFQSEGFSVDRIVKADLIKWKLLYSPTITLVNAKGKVLQYWRGKLDDQGESDVLAVL